MWFLVSYNRPDKCAELIRKCQETGMTTPATLIVNGPDQRYNQIKLPKNWKIEFNTKNLGLATAMNHALRKNPDLEWYGFLTDDVFPVTVGWDKALIKGAGDRFISHCCDGWQSETRLAGIACFGGKLLRALNTWFVPGTWHCYTDDLWEQLCRDFDLRRYCVDVLCDSPHVMNGRAENDLTYQAAYSKMEEDRKAYELYMNSPEKKRAWDEIGKLVNLKRNVVLSNRSVYIATPAGDGKFVAQYVLCLSQSIRKFHTYGVSYGFAMMEKCSILPHARNLLVKDFLKSKHTHMLFIDSDMGWPDYAPLELLAHDKDVVAAVGVVKELGDPRFCVTLDKDTLKYDQETGLIRVKQVGTGFMMIKREVLERFADHYKDLAYKDGRSDSEPIPRWFEHDLNNTDWGEDFTFCRRWREMGGEIWIDPSIQLQHVGQHAFTGRYQDALKAADDRSKAA